MSDRANVLKLALTEIETLRRRVAELETPGEPRPRAEPVAVVGMACRFPGGIVDPDSFWDLLANGVDATREVPPDRWPDNGFYAAEPAPGKSYVRRGGYLDDVAGFDPAFFGLSPRETQRMDPQQRLLLETHWEALERAGQPVDALAGSATGVFVGNTTSDFAHLQMKYVDLSLLDGHFLTGNSPSFLAGRIAFHFGLHGPTLAVDTSCSSSLVAVHLACQSLGQGECEMALASGVNLMLFPELNASLCGARMLAPDGRCKTFDAGADGYARGEGCATVVLKRLADARADSDPILAVIRGSAINHDGRSSGITVPNGAAQQAVLRLALDRAGAAPAEVDYLEAHGTGTSLGDPIEVRALGAVLGEGRQTPLTLGSVKTNFGHLEGAAGIAGLIKVILALERGEIPPHLNLSAQNPAFDLDAIPARVATELQPWPAKNGHPRLAGVSSFGASGTNAHVLVSAPPPTVESADSGPGERSGPEALHVLALSAHDETALRQLAGRFATHLTAHPEQALADVCQTANLGRTRLRHRLALHDTSAAGMASRLAAVAVGDVAASVSLATLPRRSSRWGRGGAPVAFLFSGQGAQVPEMGRELFESEPVFRRALERCDAGLRGVLEHPLLEVLYGGEGALLDQTAYTQPALFAVEYALAEQWRAWGVTPAAVLGHSVGEYVAACVAGVLSFDDALRLIARRGRLMQALPDGGAMVAVAIGEEEAHRAIAEHRGTLAIAAINGPRSTVLAGDREALDAVVAALVAAGVKTKALTVSHAFHSPRMEPMLDDLEAAAAEVTLGVPRIALVANLTGRVVEARTGGARDGAARDGVAAGPGFATPAYWRRHAREPVRFADSVATLAALGIDVLLEVGPTPTLLAMARQCPSVGKDERVLVPSLRRGRDDRQQLRSGIAELFVRGVAVDWRGIDGGRRRRRVALPTYPFQRRRFWIEPGELAIQGPRAGDGASLARPLPAETNDAAHPFLGQRLSSPLAGAQYAGRYGTGRQPLLGDFALFGHVVVNIGVYVEAFAAAAKEALGVAVPVIEDIVMPQALLLDGGGADDGDGGGVDRPVQVLVGGGCDGEHVLQLFAQQADGGSGGATADEEGSSAAWTLYAGGRLRTARESAPMDPVSLDSLRPLDAREMDGKTFYAAMEARGLKLGPAARWIDRVWHAEADRSGDGGAALARMRQSTADDRAERYGLHPGIIDCCFQLFFATLAANGAEAEPDALFMLVGVEQLRVWGLPSGRSVAETVLWCQVRRDATREGEEAGQVVAGELLLVTEEGQPVMAVTGADLRRVDRPALERSLAAASNARSSSVSGSSAEAGGSEAARRAALAALRDAAPGERLALAREGVVGAVAHVLGFAASDIDPEQPLSELGIDSLLALELRTALGNRLGLAPPLARILDGPTPARLAQQVLADIVPDDAAVVSRVGGDARADDFVAGEIVADEIIDATLPPVIDDPDHRHEPFPFTDLQEAYFFGRTGAFELGNISTYVTMEVELDGLDVDRLDGAWQRMIERHEMLRALFLPDGRQQILPRAPKPFTIAYRDFSTLDEADREQTLLMIREQMVSQVLPADGWPLFDLRVSHLGGGRCRLHIGLDALVMDAWGTSVVFKEWAAVYHQPNLALPPLEVSFRDYALVLKALEETPVYQRDLAYWLARVAGLPPAPELPLVRDPSSLSRPDFVRRAGRLEAPVWQRLKARATAAGLTPSTMMCAVYATVLAEWSKSKHFTLNVLYFNRPPLHPQVNDIAANLSATILLEVDAREPVSFLDRARALARRFWDDLEHSHVTGVRVLREYNRQHAGRAQAGMPVVFASTLALDIRQGDAGQGDLPSGLFQNLLGLGTGGAVAHTTARTPQVMLDHQIMEEAGALVFNWDAVEALFPPGLLDDMFAAYCTLLDRLIDDDAWAISATDAQHGLVSAAQLARRAAVNATEAPVPHGLLHEPFLAQARAHPERPAVIAVGRTLTYGELSARAHALAHRLRDAGVRPNDLVGVSLEKGWPQVVATLAVGLAGGAYLPIDPGLPPARIRYLLGHGQVKVAVLFGATDPLAASDEGWPEGVMRLLIEAEAPAEAPAPLDPAQAATDLAYVIFTSGSTGLPKGVMIDHRGALNTVLDVNRRFAIGPDDRVLALSALSFDLSVWDIFGLLAAGGALVIPPPDALREPGRWSALLAAHQVTVWNSVPALMEMWVDSLTPGAGGTSTLRLVMMSGDWIPVTLPDRLRAVVEGVEVISLGGATEASIWSILYPIGEVDPSWSSIPYGLPMDNQRFHVLDTSLRSRPDWVPGELYIAGIGVAQGYLHDAERTTSSFLANPVTGERLYRTGDLGRYQPDGSIELLGREDFQVKIQGYRIELGEIEVALAQHPAVTGCAVVAQGAKRGNKRLVAFVVPTAVDPADSGDLAAAAAALADRLREALRDQIASYMVPAAFVVLDALPLTANGKVDRGALAVYDTRAAHDARAAAEGDAPAVAPRDAVEAELAALWQDLLERESVGVHDDFFDLGGHSLLAVRMMAAIESRFDRRLSLATIFEGRTVEHLAALLRDENASGSTEEQIVVTIQASTPCSPEGGPAAQRPALFCVHPVSGSVLCYAPLARALGKDQPFYGLQSPATVPASEGQGDVEALATVYVAAMRSVQPQGPYHLAGWSMGGMVAYEMARQLTAVGETAAFVGLIDVAEPPDGPLVEADEATLITWFGRDLSGLTGRASTFDAERLAEQGEELAKGHEAPDTDGARLAALANWAEAEGVLPPGIDQPRLERLFAVFRRNYRALLAYRPAPFDGRITVFHTDATAAVAAAWGARAAAVEMEPLEGDHYSIVRSPRVATLANHLQRLLVPSRDAAATSADADRGLVPVGSAS